MHIYLKVKIKTLAAEAQDIRRQERKFNIGARARKRLDRALALGSIYRSSMDNREKLTPAMEKRIEKKLEHHRRLQRNVRAMKAFDGLRAHRVGPVRKEARSSFIAYGFLRGLAYSQIEKSEKPVDWERVESLVKKYGEGDIRDMMQKLAEWKDAADPVTEKA